MKNFGILLRGKSLEKIDLIIDKFDDCMIVNNFHVEFSIFEGEFKEKKITHFVNTKKGMDESYYKQFGIKDVRLAITEKHIQMKHSMVDKIEKCIKYYKNMGINVEYSPDYLYQKILKIRNSGISCILYVSECIKPDNIWIAGLDFYYIDYMVKKNKLNHCQKSKDIDLFGSFINIVKEHPMIQYNVVSYYDRFPELENLNILKSKIFGENK